MIKNALVSSFCWLLCSSSVLAESFNTVTVNGNLSVQSNGTSNLTGTVHLGDGVADSINVNGTASFDTSFTGNGTNNKLPAQISLSNSNAVAGTIVTRANGDDRYAKIVDVVGVYAPLANVVGVYVPISGAVTQTGAKTFSLGTVTSGSGIQSSGTYTNIAVDQSLTKAAATFSPSSDNGFGLNAFEANTTLSGAQALTRSIDDGGGLLGISALAVHGGSGTVAGAVGMASQVKSTSTGVTTSAVAFLGKSPAAITTDKFIDSYGVYIQDQKNSAVSGKGYGVFASGTDNLNVFAGRTRIGDGTDPASGVELDVAGDAAVSGNVSVTGNLEVDGVLTVEPKGGISMGIFTAQ